MTFEGINVKNVQLTTSGEKLNVIRTHWSHGFVELSRGLDFKRNDTIFAKIQHLNHRNFTYSFIIVNNNPRKVKATIRVFMTPKLDHENRTLSFEEQRKLMIEMDKFTHERKHKCDISSNAISQ